MTLRTKSGPSFRPGTRILIFLILGCYVTLCEGKVYFTVEEIKGLFGPNGCLEGTLAAMPAGVVVQSSPSFEQQPVVSTIDSKVMEVNDIDSQEATDLNSILANNKEKTPMCLVNELARYNKITHQYRLTDEKGPAHRKQFTVTLKLGEEEYTAEGASIKKAQHQAANIALSKTKYKHPPPKPSRSIRLGKNNITPTVELNAWAMKRGEMATYHFIAPPNTPPMSIGPACPAMGPGPIIPPVGAPYNFTYNGYRAAYVHSQIRTHASDFHRRNMYRPPFPPQYENQRFYPAKSMTAIPPPPLFSVMVRVGVREFTGDGLTAQMARHAAAAKALSEIRQLPLPDDKPCVILDNGTLTAKEEAEIKSPISLVHEVALRRGLNVKFEVVKVTGPPHMRSFHTICQVGEISTEGIGNGKKVSKRRASEKMMEELKKLPPVSPCSMSAAPVHLKAKRKPTQKKKAKNLIKEAKAQSPTEPSTNTPQEKDDINPISRLIQIQQAKKEPEPIYSLLEERGAPRRREFIMSVKVGDQYSTGSGPNKKLAKRAAAESMLLEMGYSSTGKPNVKDNSRIQETASVGGTSGRQLVPGLLLMADTTYSPPLKGSVFPQATSMAKELLQSADSQQSTSVVRPKDQLLYLASLLNFKVQFSDFPKGNHREFLSLVSLSTSPPQVCHGAGQSVDASHDQAALTALKMLAEMGLDMLNKKDSGSPVPPASLDGPAAVFNPGQNSVIFDEKPM